jgi:hypothetical protein
MLADVTRMLRACDYFVNEIGVVCACTDVVTFPKPAHSAD